MAPRAILLLALAGFLFNGGVPADPSTNGIERTVAPTKDSSNSVHVPFHVLLQGYAKLNKDYVFQIHFSDLPWDEQPRFKKTGDPLGVGHYIVGEFHHNVVSGVDKSTLELDRIDINLKVLLPFRREIVLYFPATPGKPF